MLAQEELVPYLLARNLVSPRSVVEGDLRVVNASRRNSNYKVLCERAPSLLVKQGTGRDGSATVAHEAAFYGYIHDRKRPSGLRGFLPAFHGYDRREGLLVLELVEGGRDLREHHLARAAFPKLLASAFGRALAALHRLTGEDALGESGPTPRLPPWVLSLHQPDPSALSQLSATSIELVKLIQQQGEFVRALDALRETWRPDCLIHNDVRWDNCVVYPVAAAPGSRVTRVKLIDFELAGWGDPCFDVGSMFSEYLNLWVLSIPIQGQDPPARWPELARYPLERMQPAMGAFWRTYAREMSLEEEEAREQLERAVRFAAARLVQSAYEYTQRAPVLSANVRVALQLALNMLHRPWEACLRLLGISDPAPAR